MNPLTPIVPENRIPKPRSRGDEPCAASVVVSPAAKTPLTRG